MLKNNIFFNNLIVYLCFVALIIGINLPVSIWWWALTFTIHLIVISIFSAVIHRYYCHDSFEANTDIMFLLSIISTAYFLPNPIQWRTMHGRHHAYSDKPNDPHYRGIAGFFGYGYDVATKIEPKFIKNSIKLIRDKRLVWMHSNCLLIGLVYGLCLLAYDVNLFIFAFAIPIFTTHFGSRLHKQFAHGVIDKSSGTVGAKNRWWLEYIFPMGGEWIHEEHHNVSSNPFHKTKWYHIDTGGILIKLLSRRYV
jgi:stearoyl-CoA desaturase (delta-9 desaturase)